MSVKKGKTKEQKILEEFKHGELRQKVIGAIGLGILLSGTFLVTPGFPIVFASIVGLIQDITKKEVPLSKIKRVLKNLEKKEIIYLEEKDGEVYVSLKGIFTPLTLKYSIQPLLELKRKEKKWNGKWFMVFFDVPEVQRNKRDYLRRYLKDIGFYSYQKSVYIFPYECEKEIQLIKKIVESAKYMSFIVAEKIENEDRIKTYFGLP